MSVIDLKKKNTESKLDYQRRIVFGKLVDKTLSDIDYTELAELIYGQPYSSDVARRMFYGSKRTLDLMDEESLSKITNRNVLDDIELKTAELRKERAKLSDTKNDYNKMIRQEARKESYLELVKSYICGDIPPIDIKIKEGKFGSESDLLVHLTDIHAGIEIDNYKNTFNNEVLKSRMEKYAREILDIHNRHNSENCYIVIGEILSGIIHNNLRLQNNTDLIQQFKYVSELISEMLTLLSNNFNKIFVYTTPGNHSRIIQKKEDSLDGENMDILLPFYLEARLQNIKNICICDNSVEPEISMFNIRGNTVFAAHGHKDSPATVVQNFTMLFGVKPDIILLGHRHKNGLSTVYDTKVIESGCVSGTDQYALSIRKSNNPEQTVSVIDENGLVCLYDIQLDR